MSDLYAIVYSADEVSLRQTECKQPGFCKCLKPGYDGARCGYTAAQARAMFIRYYKARVDYLEKLSDKDFLEDSGFYS